MMVKPGVIDADQGAYVEHGWRIDKPPGIKYFLLLPRVREDHPPSSWDPPVKSGEGADGDGWEDIWHSKKPGGKGKWARLPHETLQMYQKRVADNNPSIKAIKEKWNISEEHPGLAYYDTVDDEGRFAFPYQHYRFTQYLTGFKMFGPNWFDLPDGQNNCIAKTFGAAKIGFGVSLYNFMMYELNMKRGVTMANYYDWKFWAAKWPPYIGRSVAAFSLFGSVTCATGQFRKEDDFLNYLAGVAAACVIPTIRTGRMGTYFRHLMGWSVFAVIYKIYQQSGAQGSSVLGGTSNMWMARNELGMPEVGSYTPMKIWDFEKKHIKRLGESYGL